MRKWIAYLLTALFLAVSCVSELEQGGSAMDASLEGAPVTITFSVPDIQLLPATKALEDGDGDITGTPYLDPEKMYLVVCGSSQSIKYIRKATLKEIIPDFVIPEDKYPLAEGDRHTTLYKFSVQLELSDFARTIHILGNVDENQLITGSYSYQSLPGMLSFDNKQAYWQKLSVPYIKAKIDPDTHEPVKQDGHYVPDDETLGFFQYVPLIRNFAKIQVTNASENFQLHSYAVIYYPERGSVVPYRTNEPVAENRFDFNPPTSYIFSGYEKSSFEQLEEDINYLGNMPANVALSDVIPPASEFVDPSQSGGRVLLYDENDTDSGFYVYERGIPNDHIGPTFIIVCGKFNNEDDYYYYRLDLMESKVENNQTISRYYPIYRNFRYNIQLHRISSEGVLTPEAAANSSGAEDISADVSMRHLSDISNGTTRLVVEPFMTRTYSGPAEEGSYYELYARFFNDVYSDMPNLNTAAVRVELVPMEGGEDDILILYDGNGNRVPTRGFFFPEAATVGGVEGIRTIRFNTVEPLDETKMQKIKITGHNPGNHQDLRLYREVEITLQKKQPLAVTCREFVAPASNAPLTVGITIPSELPESMFPLEFIVEPEAMTLTPDTSHDEINLPVHSGRSIATTESVFTDNPAFYYIRTLTWEEFSHLTTSEGKRTFYCYFKSNQANSATSIWVYNEFFSKDSASFSNILPLTVTCTNPVIAATGTPVTVGITIPSGIPQAMFPLTFTVEPEDMTLTPDTSKGINMPEELGHFTRTLTWNDYTKLPVNDESCTFYCYFLTTQEQSATTVRVRGEYFSEGSASFVNVLPLTVTCTDPVLNVINTPVTIGITIPSDVPQSLFPLDFIVEPAAMTLTPDTSQGIDLPVESGHFLRTLTWDEYSSLPVSEDQRTFNCYFLTTQEQSATTIRVYNEHFIEGNVSFDNFKYRPDNHFYVIAIDNCTVKSSNAGEYQIDDGKWRTFSSNQNISLTAGQKVSFSVGSAQTKVSSWQNKFSCTGGRFKVGGNLASLIVGDDYPTAGAGITSANFVDFFKANTNLIDAYDLELPMTKLSSITFKSMFDGCTSLERGPQNLPATTLSNQCYRNMFKGCTSLVYAPALPATSLVSGAYQQMFLNCSSLTSITMLSKSYRADAFKKNDETTYWCDGVASEGEIWLDKSVKNDNNWNDTWGKIIPTDWTVKYVGIDDQ